MLADGSQPNRGLLVGGASAYLTRLGNMRNRIYVAMNWTMTLLLGRDVSRW